MFCWSMVLSKSKFLIIDPFRIKGFAKIKTPSGANQRGANRNDQPKTLEVFSRALSDHSVLNDKP